MNNKGSIALTILIFTLWILSSRFHQSLYLLFTFLGLYFGLTKSWNVKANYLILSFLLLSFIFTLISILKIALTGEFEVYNIKGLVRFYSYTLFAIFLLGTSTPTLKRVISLSIIYISFTLPWGLYNLTQGQRYFNIFEHPNHFAYVIAILVTYVLYNFNKIKYPKLSMFFLLVSLLLTKSSGGILTTFTIISLTIFFRFDASLFKKLTIGLLVISLIVIIGLKSPKIQEQLSDLNLISFDYLLQRARLHNAGGQGSFLWRLIYWFEIFIAFFNENYINIILGKGADALTQGNFPYEFMTYDPHNDFVKVFVEYGFIGLIMLLIFIIKISYSSRMGIIIFILLTTPMFFGNILVNFPYNLTLILVLTYFYKHRLISVNIPTPN